MRFNAKNLTQNFGQLIECEVEIIAVGDLKPSGSGRLGECRYLRIRRLDELPPNGTADVIVIMYHASSIADDILDSFMRAHESGFSRFVMTLGAGHEHYNVVESFSIIDPTRQKTGRVTEPANKHGVTMKRYLRTNGKSLAYLKIPYPEIAENFFPEDTQYCAAYRDRNGSLVIVPTKEKTGIVFEWAIQCKNHVSAFISGIELEQPAKKGEAQEIPCQIVPFGQGMKLAFAE